MSYEKRIPQLIEIQTPEEVKTPTDVLGELAVSYFVFGHGLLSGLRQKPETEVMGTVEEYSPTAVLALDAAAAAWEMTEERRAA